MISELECLLRLEALSGRISDELVSSLEQWRVPRWKLLIFLSSTFTDTQIERDDLMTKILPKLRDRVNANDIEVTFVDMRWGVLDENTCNHQTWTACQRELKRCWKESRGPFFLSLQSEKYGYTPLPWIIDAAYIEKDIKPKLSSDMKTLFLKWYRIDDNACPPVCVLKDLADVDDRSFWNGAFKHLLPVLDGISFDVQIPDLLINRSVTEYEVKAAHILESHSERAGSAPRMVWFNRRFNGGVSKDIDTEYSLFDDTSDSDSKKRLFSTLIDWMERNIPADRVSRYEDATYSSYLNRDAVWQEQFNRFSNDIQAELERAVDDILAERQRWDQDGCGLGLHGDELTEMLHHAAWAATKLSDFHGRTAIVNQIRDVVISEREVASTASSFASFSAFPGICLALVGGSGCGKTSLMAKIAQVVHFAQRESSIEALRTRPIVIRFCGTSAESVAGISVVQSVCRQLHFVIPGLNSSCPVFASMSYVQLVAHMHTLMRDHPVALFIDSLDQLSDRDLARSELSFLRGVSLHPLSRIVVSTLPDERGAGVAKYWYGCESLLQREAVPRLPLSTTNDSNSAAVDEACAILDQLLQRRQRRLSAEQWAYVRKQIILEPTPLYIQLTLRVVSTWRSWSTLAELVLPSGVQPLINHIITIVENQFGRTLVRAALGFLSYAIQGVTDREMCDLLTLHDGVMTSVNTYNTADSLPPHVWLRVRGEIDGLISEGEEGCLTWYHRQLQETVEARYDVEEKRLLSVTMGTYFGNIVTPSAQEKCTRVQSLTLSRGSQHVPVWMPRAKVNKRRCVEAGAHLIDAGLYPEACVELCSLEAVYARAEVEQAFALLQQLSQLSSHSHELTTEQALRTEHYLRWLRRCVHSVTDDPIANVLASSRTEPELSVVRSDFRALASSPQYDRPSVPLTTQGALTLCTICGSPAQTFSPLQNVLEGHTRHVNAVSFSPCGRYIASASDDCTLRVWDAVTGQLRQSFEGHIAGSVPGAFIPVKPVGSTREAHAPQLTFAGRPYPFNQAVYNPDYSIIVTGSDDCTVRLWDATSGELLHTLEGHTAKVSSVGFNPTGDLILSSGYDHKLMVWDRRTGTRTLVVDAQRIVYMSSFSTDGSSLISRTVSKSLQVWSAVDGSLLSSFENHRVGVASVAYSRSGSRLVSGGEDATVRVWDASTGFQFYALQGHSEGVSSIAFSPLDETQIVSGSYDKSIILWNIETGVAERTYEGHTEGVLAVAFNASATCLASGSWDRTVRVWDTASATLLWTRDDHSSGVHSVSFHPSADTLLSVCMGGQLRLWSVDLGEVISSGISNGALAGAFNADGTNFLIGGRDGKLRIVDSSQESMGNVIVTLFGHSADVHCVCYSADGTKFVSGSADNSVRIFDVVSHDDGSVFGAHTRWVRSVVFSRDGSKIISSSHDTTIRVFDATSFDLLQTLKGHTADIWAVDVNNDGTIVLSGSWDTTVKLWSLISGESFLTLNDHTDKVNAAVFSPDNQLMASGSNDKTVKLWNATDGTLSSTLVGHKGGVSTLSFSPNGSRLVSGSWDKSIRCWNIVTGEVVSVMSDCAFGIISVAYHPDGETVASGSSDKAVRLWNSSDGRQLRVIEGHTNWVNSVAFSPDGTIIASGSSDSSVRLWDVSAGVQLAQLGGLSRHLGAYSLGIRTICFSPDGLRLVSGGYDNTVRVWDAVSTL